MLERDRVGYARKRSGVNKEKSANYRESVYNRNIKKYNNYKWKRLY